MLSTTSGLVVTATASLRLGLTATAPEPDSPAAQQIETLVGPVVCHIGLGELIGTHLAELAVIRRAVRLDRAELDQYLKLVRPFQEMRNAFVRANRGADLAAILRGIGRSAKGQKTISDYHRACEIASFPRSKRAMFASLLQRHRGAKTLVFKTLANDACQLAHDSLIPVITSDVGR